MNLSDSVRVDLRNTTLFQEIENSIKTVRQPGTGQISDAAEVSASPDGRHAVFSATLMDKLEGTPPTRIALTELATGDTRVLTFGPNTDRLPKFSPDSRQVAFLSDRHKAGDFQLYLLDPVSGAAHATPAVEGWVEYLHWSPDGKRILLGVAGHGADISGGQGAVTTKQAAQPLASWMPSVQIGDERYRWRRAWVYELATCKVSPVTKADSNTWEVSWCGNDALVAVVSPGPGEGLWYDATLHVIQTQTGESHELFRPEHQLGWPSASPSGKHVAVVEALCSDRWVVAGDLRLIDTASGKVRPVDTQGVDIGYTEWRSEQKLLVAGYRGFETVIGLCDAHSGSFTEVWSSPELAAAGGFYYPAPSGIGDLGECVLSVRGFVRAPEIAVVRRGDYKVVRSFDLGYAAEAKAINAIERFTWKASDGLEIQGWLLLPAGHRPHPLVMWVHGGPVALTPPTWLSPLFLMLLKRGYAVFFPNPRGSSGRGQAFARHVYGEMGSADGQDLLSGLDELIKCGFADPKRLGVIGGSYGGFMTSWLITQDNRFAAAVSVSPVTNYTSGHLISNIPQFYQRFLNDTYTNPGGKYFQRSPIMHAHKVKTPTLNIGGALDRCTPPGESVQFHNALLENGVESVLVIYPEEGHGIRKLPAAIDYAARVVGWFDRHMGSRCESAEEGDLKMSE